MRITRRSLLAATTAELALPVRGAFAADGALRIGGRLPINTDGGGLCNNHPGYQGGMIKIIEAVRQLRGEDMGRSRP